MTARIVTSSALALLLSLSPACLSSDQGTAQLGSSTEPTADPVLEDPVLDEPAPDELGADPIQGATEVPPVDVPPPNAFVVHEWGTFTSVQDSEGNSQPGLHHEDEELPGWVHRRDLGPNAYYEMLPEEPLQQLETPVVYFYSDEPRDVQFTVAFPEGIISQWFPDAVDFAPLPYEMSAIAGGSMSWDVHLDPAISPDDFLPVDPMEIWAPSRRVASTPLSFAIDPAGKYVEYEQFIFYRGLGNFDLPVRTRATASEGVRITNESNDDIAAVVILSRTKDGGAIKTLGALPAKASMETDVPDEVMSEDTYREKARATLKQAILSTGLYDDEAQSMVDTWTRSWFDNLGVRVLYLVPDSWTDRLLPIAVTPEPDEVVRTLVGRIEILTPAMERETQERIQALDESGTWQDYEAAIDDLGRFTEPRVRAFIQKHGRSDVAEELLSRAHVRP